MSKLENIKVSVISKEEGLNTIRKYSEYPNQLGIIVDQESIEKLSDTLQKTVLPETQQQVIDDIINKSAIKRKNTKTESSLDKIKEKINAVKKEKANIRKNDEIELDKKHKDQQKLSKNNKNKKENNKNLKIYFVMFFI